MEATLLTNAQPARAAYGCGKNGRVSGFVLGALGLIGLAFYSTDQKIPTFAVGSKGTGLFALEANAPVFMTETSWVEARADGWAAAADAIVAQLKQAGVKRGQIVSIDAHNNGPNDQAIFSAYFTKNGRDNGELAIQWTAQNNNNYGWGTFYSKAAANVDTTDVISMTSSSNEVYSKSTSGRVLFVFSYAPAAKNDRINTLKYVEARGDNQGWKSAADGIVSSLKSAGVQRGQIVRIDAHNNGIAFGDSAIFTAYYDLTLPGYGALDIEYKWEETDNSGWGGIYGRAATEATTGVISLTSSSTYRVDASKSRSVTFVFNYK